MREKVVTTVHSSVSFVHKTMLLLLAKKQRRSHLQGFCYISFPCWVESVDSPGHNCFQLQTSKENASLLTNNMLPQWVMPFFAQRLKQWFFFFFKWPNAPLYKHLPIACSFSSISTRWYFLSSMGPCLCKSEALMMSSSVDLLLEVTENSFPSSKLL